MKTTVIGLLLTLLAGAAVAQKPQSDRVYGLKDGHFTRLDSVPPGAVWLPAPTPGRQPLGQPGPGSYRDPLAACSVKARGRYTGPASTIGFRCVCRVSYPNRK